MIASKDETRRVINIPIYARDIKPELQTDEFFGIGFERALKQYDEIIVGYFIEKPIAIKPNGGHIECI